LGSRGDFGKLFAFAPFACLISLSGEIDMKLFGCWNCLWQPMMGLGWAGESQTESLLAKRPADAQSLDAEERERSGLVKTDAEDLLDWLEAHGCAKYEISSANGETFAVHWWN
jgi:hypothetical protein